MRQSYKLFGLGELVIKFGDLINWDWGDLYLKDGSESNPETKNGGLPGISRFRRRKGQGEQIKKEKLSNNLSRYNFSELEEIYIHVRNVHSRLNSKIDDWTKPLESEDQEDPIYPDRGMPESISNPAEDLT